MRKNVITYPKIIESKINVSINIIFYVAFNLGLPNPGRSADIGYQLVSRLQPYT